MYSNYEQYTERGGKLPEKEYNIKAQKASELIDYRTMGRAETASADMAKNLSACECELVDLLQSMTGISPAIQAENNDRYSVTFASQQEQDAAINRVLRCYLTSPQNLLEIAGWAYV